jgi:hypothetical protein
VAFCEIERPELSRRWSHHPARAALASLARSWTMATNPELATMLGLPRGEYLPSLSQRFATSLESDAKVRWQFKSLEQELGKSAHSKKSKKHASQSPTPGRRAASQTMILTRHPATDRSEPPRAGGLMCMSFRLCPFGFRPYHPLNHASVDSEHFTMLCCVKATSSFYLNQDSTQCRWST